MKEHPVLFSTPMVQALLNTKPGVWPAEPLDPSKPFKSMTRRVVKPQPDKDDSCVNYCTVEGFQTFPEAAEEIWAQTEKGESVQLKSKYQEGDILWVRETWCKQFDNTGDKIEYLTDWYNKNTKTAEIIDSHDRITIHCLNPYGFECPRWKPSIHMPREAARIFLEVKNVRIERVQDITEDDAKSEGVEEHGIFNDFDGYEHIAVGLTTPRQEFCGLWDTLNAKKGYSWERNPWVWVIEFMRTA
jgi:hypothetical protein